MGPRTRCLHTPLFSMQEKNPRHFDSGLRQKSLHCWLNIVHHDPQRSLKGTMLVKRDGHRLAHRQNFVMNRGLVDLGGLCWHCTDLHRGSGARRRHLKKTQFL